MPLYRKFKPVTSEYQTLRAMSDQMDTNTPIVRHIVTMPKQPTAPQSIHLCPKDKYHKHWKAGVWNHYDKRANMDLFLSEPGVKEFFRWIVAINSEKNDGHI